MLWFPAHIYLHTPYSLWLRMSRGSTHFGFFLPFLPLSHVTTVWLIQFRVKNGNKMWRVHKRLYSRRYFRLCRIKKNSGTIYHPCVLLEYALLLLSLVIDLRWAPLYVEIFDVSLVMTKYLEVSLKKSLYQH